RVVGVVRAKREAKEREALLTGIFQRGFSLVDRQPKLGHHPLRPRQRLGRTTVAEDDEVVGIGDNMSAEVFTASALTPMFQEPVHVDVGEQGACNTTLGVPRLFLLPPTMRRFPLPSRSSIGAFNHSLISRSTEPSATRRATDLNRSSCGTTSV